MKSYQLAGILFGFWVVLTASFDPVELAVGLVLSVAVAVWSARFMWTPADAPHFSGRQAIRFLAYIPRLVVEIIRSCVFVAEKVLDPRLPIGPRILSFDTSLVRPISRITLANSITLTPGTLTVDIEGDTYLIHCLGAEFADGVLSREMEQQIAHALEEG